MQEWFVYDNGLLLWRKKLSSGGVRKPGKVAGHIRPSGRRYITFAGANPVPASRLIFCYHHGYMPEEVDHIDGDCSNDRIGNLRRATKRENGLNTVTRSINKRWKGVHKHKHCSTYEVRVWNKKKNINIGCTRTEEDGALAWNFAMYNKFPEDRDFIKWNSHPLNEGIESTWPAI